MKRLLALGLLLVATAPRTAQAELIWPFSSLFRENPSSAAPPGGALPPNRGWTRPHPSVVRVIVPENGSTSYGSGTLVNVHDRYGLIITNYHVVSDATGPATVLFPDGFQSAAQVVKVDRDWDLAALAIWKPDAEPVPISSQAARPGEWLTIAGYGQGPYRAASGQCTQYVAPGMRLPMETVEVAVAARQGDSGGPILNARGELAGVLWGAGGGRTAGSYCGRVQQFLASIIPSTPAPTEPGGALVVAASAGLAAAEASPPRTQPITESPQPAYAAALTSVGTPPAVAHAPSRFSSFPEVASQPAGSLAAPPKGSDGSTPAGGVETISFGWQELAGNTRLEQAKTLLAAVGIAALALHFRKFLIQHG